MLLDLVADAPAPGAVPLAAVPVPAAPDTDPVGKGGLEVMVGAALEVALAEVIAGGASLVASVEVGTTTTLLSGVTEASTAAVLDGGAAAAVAAHAHTATPADEAARPVCIPHACSTHPIAELLIAATLSGSHWHFKSPCTHPTDLEAS